MKKRLTQWISAGTMSLLLCACGGKGVADGDYAGAFQVFAQDQLKAKTWTLTADENLSTNQINSIQVEVIGRVTVADSLELARQDAASLYNATAESLKLAMDEAERNYNLDAQAQFAYRKEYEKEMKKLQAAHGNDRNYASKINSYKEKIASMPKDMDAYMKFDKARGYSYVRLFEEAQKRYQDFTAVSLEDYTNNATAQYANRDTTDVLAVMGLVSFVTPTGEQAVIALFNESPTFVQEIVTE